MRKHELQIANFICTFGDRGDLIDFVDEIVIPSFFTDTLVRKYGSTSYYVYEPRWISLGGRDPELAICGRFVKDTVLKREQIVSQGELVVAYDEMKSAPSAFFILLLRDHRLLYFAETAFAPDLQSFSSTMQIFLRRVWRNFLRLKHHNSEVGVTYKELEKEYPRPRLNIVPVAKEGVVSDLMGDFDRIEKIRFRLIRPNQETDASQVLQSVRDRLQPLRPSRLTLEVSDSEGLDKDESIDVVKEVVSGHNTDIVVSGFDESGNKLKLDNNNFALKISIEDPPTEEKKLAYELYAEFVLQAVSGAVRRFIPSESVIKKIDSLRV